MSLTDTARHWFWGCALATAASRSDVNVAMPHLRGKWSPTKAILRTLELSFIAGIPLLPGGLAPLRSIFSGLRYRGEMKGIPQILQLPVIINRGGSLSLNLRALRKAISSSVTSPLSDS